MEMQLTTLNSHLSLGVNKKKTYSNCFEMFHKLDEDVQCCLQDHRVSNVYAIQKVKLQLFEVLGLDSKLKTVEQIITEISASSLCSE